MTFSVDGTALKCTSDTVKKSLDPTWKQVMTLELPKGLLKVPLWVDC